MDGFSDRTASDSDDSLCPDYNIVVEKDTNYMPNYSPMRLRNVDSVTRSSEAVEAEKFQDAYEQVHAPHRNRCNILLHFGVRLFPSMQKALKYYNESPRFATPIGIFAHDRPVKRHGKIKIKYVKHYLVGNVDMFYRYARSLGRKVMLEECVLSFLPQRLHFDIEIKKYEMDESRFQNDDWLKVLRFHMMILPTSLDADDGILEKVLSDYRDVSAKDLTDKECWMGLKIMSDFVNDFVMSTVGGKVKHWKAVSGCRKEKFSFHLIAADFFVDSNVKSMPLFVYELARHFQIQNLKWVVEHYAFYGSDVDPGDYEVMFRLRALMIFHLVQHTDIENKRDFRFVGMDDTPFDEAVYSTNHLLRAAGACKTTTSALHPVTIPPDPNELMISDEILFDRMFPHVDNGFRNWVNHLITFRVKCDDGLNWQKDDCLCGMMPIKAYPRERRWRSTSGRAEIAETESRIRKEYNIVAYSHTAEFPMFVDRRPRRYESAEVTSRHMLYITQADGGDHIMDARDTVDPDTMFVSEDGVRKPFRLFAVDEWFHHNHNGTDESTPSARVFPGGFRCFGCNTTYIVPRSRPFEELYEFTRDEITRSDNPMDYMPVIPWLSLVKKFTVVQAPMGAGKTQQLSNLFDALEARDGGLPTIIVLAFRQLLAKQQGVRFGFPCYSDLSNADMASGPEQVTVCLNSVMKLGVSRYGYEYVILDEAGLIRRHFMSKTMTSIVDPIYDKLVFYIQKAKRVILLQDGISTEDVDFYTSMCDVDAIDRNKVDAICFKKPIVIHPIIMTMEFYHSLANIRRCYIGSVVDGTCEHPFMVFCTSCVLAEYISRMLKVAASEVNADPERIKGIWGGIKNTDAFCITFADNPNRAAQGADVIVCTSVIGAGFSINRRFESFHALFSCNILAFHEECQFIQRLRFIMEFIPASAVRQSYLYIEKGRGSAQDFVKVKINFEMVRKIMINYRNRRRITRVLQPASPNESLAIIEACLHTEKSATTALHDLLWKQYGNGVLQSDFIEVEVPLNVTDDEVEFIRDDYTKLLNSPKKDITAYCLGYDEDDVSGSIQQFEANVTNDLLRLCECKNVTDTLEKAFKGYYNALMHIIKVYDVRLANKKNKNESYDNSPTLSAKLGPPRFIARVNSFVCWLQCKYHDELLDSDQSALVHNMYRSTMNKATSVQKTAHLFLAENLIEPLLSIGGHEIRDKEKYLNLAGCLPSFSGAEFQFNAYLANAVKDLMEVNQDSDAADVITHKTHLRNSYKVLFRKSYVTDKCMMELYDPRGGDKMNFNALRNLFKTILDRIGINIRHKKGTIRVYRVTDPCFIFACTLCAKKSLREKLIELLPLLLLSDHGVDESNRVWMRSGMDMFMEACRVTGTSPNCNIAELNAQPITHRLCVTTNRMIEMRELEVPMVTPGPVVTHAVDDWQSSVIRMSGDVVVDSPVIRRPVDLNSVGDKLCDTEDDEDGDDDDSENCSMIDHEAIPGDLLIEQALANCENQEEKERQREKQRALDDAHILCCLKYKKETKGASRNKKRKLDINDCAFIDGSAGVDRRDEYESTDGDESSGEESDESNENSEEY